MNNQKPSNRMHYGLPRMALACRGNTLAPVVIALFISAVASIAFLQQGAQLSEKQKLIRAPEEAFEYAQEWINLRKQKKNHYEITSAELSFHKTNNVFGYGISYEQGNTLKPSSIQYPTKSQSHCIQLKSILEKYDAIEASGNGRKITCGHWVYGNPSLLYFEFKE